MVALAQAPSFLPATPPVEISYSMATLTKMAFEGQNMVPIQTKLFIEILHDPANVAALMSLAIIEQLKGNLNVGLDYQSSALSRHQLYSMPSKAETKLRILVLAAPIHMGGNTPIEFLLENSAIDMTTLYVLPDIPLPNPLPDHDLAFVAAPGDSDHTREFLVDIEQKIKNWPRPVLNHPRFIAQLERDVLCRKLDDITGLVAPETIPCDRLTLMKIAQGSVSLDQILPGGEWPVVVRPVGSHAGRNLEKLTGIEQIKPYLATCADVEFFLTRFIDYRSDDRWFRKYRIVFINGRAFACHMAISDQWKIWYKNAEMVESAAKRSEEEHFMVQFDADFGARHEKTFSALTARVGLDYFGIDCAETRDGELIVFEADNALIIHDMDPKDVFPYKSPQMQKVFAAFEGALLGMTAKA